ncbi:YhcN/YlaJ family sporulation lipoprotein [Paenibacillus doosanensis]|uniref:Lipoprotein YhcN n=1 Tax=Paenibacillus konkukensis TaxID=2020716 RepID=A0ABY4RI04_9BACL|nr:MULTISPECIES: YhcN/YlaJ family sporulation lipoprotein [Paenibacillus]MCS7461965.1 YhcN/YlaJ family sporulation lipoprotein [Paenibacillus doosanensis]UQZ81476.1 Lipoprotein YhcN precursor [Paenibacillus konkukensis]
MFKFRKQSMVCALSVVLLAGAAAGCAKNQAAQPSPNQGGTARQQTVNQSPTTIQDSRIMVANQAAEKIAQLPGIKSANVLVTQHNAYVAAILKDTTVRQVSQDVENQIAQQVKSSDPNIHNVYVSTNPDFVQRVNTYVADVGAGRPVSGFVNEFAEMVKRVFPTAH